MFRFLLCLQFFVLGTGLLAQMSQQAYVWQRSWSQAVKSAIKTQCKEVDGLTVLAAEFHPADPFRPALIDLDYEQLRAIGCPVTLALRMNWSSSAGVRGAFQAGFTDLIVHAIREARAHGLEPAAIEIDFDCPTSKLEAYAAELGAIREQLDGVALSITTLPTWMNRPKSFQQLVAETDRYVLQVHSIEPAHHIDTRISLCDPADALRWTRQAAAYSKPYHVALPTYGYRLAYDESGQLVEVAGENASSIKDPSWRYRVVRANPEQMAHVVRELELKRPENCLGVIWYRLPIGEERLNWDPKTWQAVKRGKVERVSWGFEMKRVEEGLFQLEIVQKSVIATPPPATLHLSWRQGGALAWDGQRNYAVKQHPEHGLIWQWPDTMPPSLLAQGTRWTIGWLRMNPKDELEFSISEYVD